MQRKLNWLEQNQLPAVAWRQFNLDKTSPEKRAALVESLKKSLSE
jgi:hypothetical protein